MKGRAKIMRGMKGAYLRMRGMKHEVFYWSHSLYPSLCAKGAVYTLQLERTSNNKKKIIVELYKKHLSNNLNQKCLLSNKSAQKMLNMLLVEV